MRSRLVLVLALLTGLAGFSGRAEAHVFNALGRYLGVGWSNGYHAQDACCPGPVWAFRPGFTPPPHPMCGPASSALFETVPGNSAYFSPSYGYGAAPYAPAPFTPTPAAPLPSPASSGMLAPQYPAP